MRKWEEIIDIKSLPTMKKCDPIIAWSNWRKPLNQGPSSIGAESRLMPDKKRVNEKELEKEGLINQTTIGEPRLGEEIVEL